MQVDSTGRCTSLHANGRKRGGSMQKRLMPWICKGIFVHMKNEFSGLSPSLALSNPFRTPLYFIPFLNPLFAGVKTTVHMMLDPARSASTSMAPLRAKAISKDKQKV